MATLRASRRTRTSLAIRLTVIAVSVIFGEIRPKRYPLRVSAAVPGCQSKILLRPIGFFDSTAGLGTLADRGSIRYRGLRESSRMSADDRLSLDPPGPVEGGDGIVEGSHVADVCPQPAIPDPLHELTQLGAIGFDD